RETAHTRRTARKRSARTGCADARNTPPGATIPRRAACPRPARASGRRRTAESCASSAGPGEASVDIPPETHRRLALDQAARRHDQHAIVVGGAHLAAVVPADQHAFVRQHLETMEIAGEIETVAADRHRLGHFDRALPRL